MSVEKLFHNLPVRRRELERNIKREWHKVIALLNQYACIQTNMKFSVSQQPTKGKKILLFSTKGNQKTRDNIINIFGAKTVNALVALELKLEMRPTVSSIALQNPSADEERGDSGSKGVQVLGFVSRPVHGEGRQTPDRQMFFVNGRPCGLPQFAKTFNEVYKSYNYSQSPFIFADIRLDTNMYDVNVSPDKRSILLHDQNHMLDNLRAALTELFDEHDFSVPVAQAFLATPQSTSSKAFQTPATLTTSETQSSTHFGTESEELSDAPEAEEDDDGEDDAAVSSQPTPSLPRRAARGQSSGSDRFASQSLISRWASKKLDIDDDSETERALQRRNRSFASINDKRTEIASDLVSDEETEDSPMDIDKPLPVKDFNKRLAEKASGTPSTHKMPPLSFAASASQESPIPASQPMRIHNYSNFSPRASNGRKRETPEVRVTIGGEEDEQGPLEAKRARLSDESEEEDEGEEANEEEDQPLESTTQTQTQDEPEAESEAEAGADEDEAVESSSEAESVEQDDPASKDEENMAEPESAQPNQTAEASARKFDVFQSGSRKNNNTLNIQQTISLDDDTLQQQSTYFNSQAFRDTSAHRNINTVEDIDAADAESKLQLIISKGDFGKMRVAGQFNLGFIIAVRPGSTDSKDDDELFIIDQHASDEKYNFERLQATTVVQSQRLVHPKRLQLTALEEEIVIENIEAIETNGFKISVDNSGDEPVGSRCELTALPLSRETAFSLDDLEELIAILGESAESSHVPRPAKVRKMFAMRACRSSVMIGKALNKAQMYNLVRHMGELDKPWNCPHGRPTMRHLCRLEAWDERRWKCDAELDAISSWKAFAQE